MTYPYGGGYNCAVCGMFVPNGVLHSCGCAPWTPPIQPPTIRWNQTGWECPSCGSGVAPFMPYCPHCAPKKDAPPTDGAADARD